MCCALGMCPGPYVGGGGSKDTPFFGKILLSPILRDSQVPQLGAKSLCLCPQTCAYFHSCTSPFSHGFPFCIFTHIEIPPDDRKLTSLSVKFGEIYGNIIS